MEFGILRLDDGMTGFSGWGGKWDTDNSSGFCLLTIRFEHHKREGKDTQKVYEISVY